MGCDHKGALRRDFFYRYVARGEPFTVGVGQGDRVAPFVLSGAASRRFALKAADQETPDQSFSAILRNSNFWTLPVDVLGSS